MHQGSTNAESDPPEGDQKRMRLFSVIRDVLSVPHTRPSAVRLMDASSFLIHTYCQSLIFRRHCFRSAS
jgi:hypothetical protein